MATERFPYRARTAGLHSYPPADYLHEHEAAGHEVARHPPAGDLPDSADARPVPGQPVWRYQPLPRTIQE